MIAIGITCRQFTCPLLGIFESDVLEDGDLAPSFGIGSIKYYVEGRRVCGKEIIEVKSEERSVGAHIET